MLAMPRPIGSVTLDIGGRHFKTTTQTLTNVPESYFGRMFSGSWSPQKDELGHVFIDRNGDLFGYILAFMRDGPKVDLPKDRAILHELRKEADYYALADMVKIIDKKLYDPNRVIILNVGGREVPVTVRTLQKAPTDSILYRLTGPQGTAMEDSNGRVFIDRDGKYFDYIIEYLRTGEIDLPQDVFNRFLVRKLEKEAVYYRLIGLRDCLYDRLHPWRMAFEQTNKRSQSQQSSYHHHKSSISIVLADEARPISVAAISSNASTKNNKNEQKEERLDEASSVSDENTSHQSLSVTI